MILTYSTTFRAETDPQVIATLLRKGWTEARMDVQLVAADDPRVADGYPAGYPDTVAPLAAGAVAEHTEMTQAEVEALRAQHTAALEAYNNRPRPWRVTKDCIMLRISAKGDSYVVALDDLLLAQPRAKQILWRDFAWFSSDNASVRAAITAIGLDPEEILAPEVP